MFSITYNSFDLCQKWHPTHTIRSSIFFWVCRASACWTTYLNSNLLTKSLKTDLATFYLFWRTASHILNHFDDKALTTELKFWAAVLLAIDLTALPSRCNVNVRYDKILLLHPAMNKSASIPSFNGVKYEEHNNRHSMLQIKQAY
jgi:hypothetical protein